MSAKWTTRRTWPIFSSLGLVALQTQQPPPIALVGAGVGTGSGQLREPLLFL